MVWAGLSVEPQIVRRTASRRLVSHRDPAYSLDLRDRGEGPSNPPLVNPTRDSSVQTARCARGDCEHANDVDTANWPMILSRPAIEMEIADCRFVLEFASKRDGDGTYRELQRGSDTVSDA